MMSREEAEKLVVQASGGFDLDTNFGEWVVQVLTFVEGNVKLPTSSKPFAVAIGRERVAALIYECVWDPTGLVVPESIRCCAGTEDERYRALGLFFELGQSMLEGATEYTLQSRQDQVEHFSRQHPKLAHQFASSLNREQRDIVSAVWAVQDSCGVPVYVSTASRDREYQRGDTQVVVPILEGLQIIDEDSLTWDQVLQFRDDTKAREAIGKIHHWLDKDMVGQPESIIRKEIELRLKDYDDALQKHGLKCLYKGIAALTLGGLAVHLFGALADPLQAVTVGAGVVASVALASIDGQPTAGDEIALVVEARDKLGD